MRITKTKSFYIQVNTGDEPQKSGIDPLHADSFIKYCINDLKLTHSWIDVHTANK